MWPLNLFWTTYLGLGLIAWAFELLRPAHPTRYRKVVPFDVVALCVYQFGVVQIAFWITSSIQISYLHSIYEIPLWLRVIAFYLLADLGSYWMHRLMHTHHLWSVHRFHHSVTDMWWLAGVRSTVPQQLLFNTPYILVGPLIAGRPSWLSIAIMVEGIVRNHEQHMNFTWRSRWLEYVFVTPRYHHLHHSAGHRGNYGSLFTFWDRMFGTRLDPDVEQVKEFGTGEAERHHPVRMMLGI